MRPWGIRTRFITALLIFAVTLSGIFTVLTTDQVSNALYSQTKERGRMMLKRLAKDVVDAYSLEDPLEREIRLLVLANRTMLDDARYVQVVLNGQQVVASAEEGWLPNVEAQWIEEENIVSEREQFGERLFDFLSPLPPGEHGSSYVRFGLSLAPVQMQVREIVQTTIWVALLFGAIGLVLATWLYRGVFGPLNRLLHSVRQLAGGDQTARASIRTGDELQELADEFNRMADAIESRTAQLEQANARLARADQAKGDFLATMSHEWKTPLHSLRGYAQLLLEEVDGPLTEAQREDVEAMLASANHLLDLIENVLHFIQSEYDDLPNHLESLDLVALIRQAWDHVRPAARARNIQCYDDLPAELWIRGDRTRLRQVLINIIGNAVHYTSVGSITLRGGKVDGQCGPEDGKSKSFDMAWLSVSDTGIGIPLEFQATIFEPFQRGRDLRTAGKIYEGGKSAPRAEGLGLGLTVARRYVDLHGGHISVRSTPGAGSTFTIRLPINPLKSGVSVPIDSDSYSSETKKEVM